MEPSLPQLNTQPSPVAPILSLDILSKIERIVLEDVIPSVDTKASQLILRELHPFFAQNSVIFREQHTDVYEKWEGIFAKLQWINLIALKPEVVIELLEFHFVECFEIPFFSPWDQFRKKLAVMLIEEQEDVRKKAKEALLRNTQEITMSRLIIETHEVLGTVQNWLADYNLKLGTFFVDSVAFAQYVTQGQNTADLGEEDRSRLQELFRFYEQLKHSAFFPEGIEEELEFTDADGKMKVFFEGKIEPLQTRESQEMIEKVKAMGISPNWDGTPANLPIINPNGEPQPLAMPQAVENKTESGVLESQPQESRVHERIAAQYNTLPFAKEDLQHAVIELESRMAEKPKILHIVLAYPKKLHNKAYVVGALLLAGQRDELDEIAAKMNMSSSQAFVRALLEETLLWSSEDSAKIGIRIAHVNKKYHGWAHYNTETNMFEWAKAGNSE